MADNAFYERNTLELPNPLHKYASYNVLFTLSSVTEESIREGRYLRNPDLTDVIARSSGIGPDGGKGSFRTNERNSLNRAVNREGPSIRTDMRLAELRQEYGKYTDSIKILHYNHDLFIENVNMLSTISPNAERNMSNFTKMEFEIHEPFGITFIEKVRAATFLAGYDDYQDAPLLLTMEFRGFDENGRVLKGGTTETRKVPILIAKVDFDVNEGGARYSITAVPYADMGFDDRFKVLRTRIELTSPSDVFKTWKRKMEEGLEKQMQNEIDEKVREYADVYKFEVAPDLFAKAKNFAYSDEHVYAGTTVKEEVDKDAKVVPPVNSTEEDISTEGNANPERRNNTTQYADSGTTVTKAFEDWLRNHPGFFDIAEDFWRAYLTMAGLGPFSEDTTKRTEKIQQILADEKKLESILLEYQYVPWFKIKSTTFTDVSKQDGVTKMHPKIITYRAIPYKIHVLKLLATGLSIGTINWSKFVRKSYDYIYTGDNVDVQGLRINYKTAYYMRNVRGDDKNENESSKFKLVKRVFNQVFGAETDPEPLLPLRSYPSNIKGRSTVENFKSNGNKSQEFFDYLTNPEADMLRIELDILGDPHYICQDVLAALKLKDGQRGYGAIGKTVTTETVIKSTSDFDEEQFGCFNADQYMPLINLRYRLPTDPKENEGTMFNNGETQQDNVFFNGVYQVVRVDSKFDQGQFLQTLTCVRMNNQQGQGLAPQVILSSVEKYSKPQDKTEKTTDYGYKPNVTEQLGDINEIG